MCASPRRGRTATRGVGATGPRVKVSGLKAKGRRGLTVLEDAGPGQRLVRGPGIWDRGRRGRRPGREMGLVVGNGEGGPQAALARRLGRGDQSPAILGGVLFFRLGE